MGRLMAALSIVALINNSFNMGLSKTIEMIISYYDEFVRLIFSWAEPYLQILIQYFSHLIDLKIILSKYWHHVFVVMWILFLRDSTVAFSDGRKKLGIVRGITGFLIAIVFSLLAGINIGFTSNLKQNAWLAIMPYLGIYIYDLIMYAYAAIALKPNSNGIVLTRKWLSMWRFFKENALRAHIRFALILCGIDLCLLAIPYFSNMPFPKGGLIILAIATIINLSYWIIRGIHNARKSRSEIVQGKLGTWYSHFLKSESGRFSLAVGSVFLWIWTFILLNTGTKILGF